MSSTIEDRLGNATTESRQPTADNTPFLSFSIDYILGNSFGKRKDKVERCFDKENEKEEDFRKINNRLTHTFSKPLPTNWGLVAADTVTKSDRKAVAAVVSSSYPAFDWVECTRYRPPKVPRKFLF